MASGRLCAINSVRCAWSFPPRSPRLRVTHSLRVVRGGRGEPRMDANGRSWGNALADGRCPNSRANGAEWDNSGQRPGFMRWNRRMFHTKARSHEGGWLVAPTTLVALRKRVWCLATFVDLVSHCPSHDSLRESQGNSATKPGVTPSAALPRVWSESAPQPRRGLCPTAHGCAAEALLWVTSQHINSPERVVPSHHQGRLSAGARIRQNGERHGWFSVSQATLNRVIRKLYASAQPRWGREWCVWVGVDRFAAMDGGQRRWRCSAIVAHTRGNAGLWGRTLSAFPEGEEGPIHPKIHRIIPQNPTRGPRA